jgi:hypothetical protein
MYEYSYVCLGGRFCSSECAWKCLEPCLGAALLPTCLLDCACFCEALALFEFCLNLHMNLQVTESLKLANIDKDGKIDYREFTKVRHRRQTAAVASHCNCVWAGIQGHVLYSKSLVMWICLPFVCVYTGV